MRGMVSATTQGARIPHLSHFHHGGIRSALGSEVRVPDLLSDHWLFGKTPPYSPQPPPAPQGHYCEISSHCQVFLVPPLMILAVFLLQRYSPITHSFLPSPVRTFSHSFLPLSYFHVTTDDSDVSVGLLGSVQSSFPPASSHPPNPLWYLRQPSFTLTEAPACGSMLYFFWMKGLNENAFLFPL